MKTANKYVWKVTIVLHRLLYYRLDLPYLTTITLGNSSLLGDCRENRHSIDRIPYNFKNKLTMRSMMIFYRIPCVDLPLLTKVEGKGYNFQCVGEATFESMSLICL